MKQMMAVLLSIFIFSALFLLLKTESVEEREIHLPEKTLISIEGEEVYLWDSVGERDLLLLFIHPEIESSLLQIEYLEAIDPPVTMRYILLGHFPEDTVEEVAESLKNRDLLLIDRDALLGKYLEVYSIPTILLFDRTGKVKKRYVSLLREEEVIREFPH